MSSWGKCCRAIRPPSSGPRRTPWLPSSPPAIASTGEQRRTALTPPRPSPCQRTRVARSRSASCPPRQSRSRGRGSRGPACSAIITQRPTPASAAVFVATRHCACSAGAATRDGRGWRCWSWARAQAVRLSLPPCLLILTPWYSRGQGPLYIRGIYRACSASSAPLALLQLASLHPAHTRLRAYALASTTSLVLSRLVSAPRSAGHRGGTPWRRPSVAHGSARKPRAAAPTSC